MSESPAGVGHSNSADSNDAASGNAKTDEKKKTRRPANTAFRQQRLKAWQPILTPRTVLPLFFTIGLVFAPLGGLLLFASSQVQMIRIDYTTCHQDAPLDLNHLQPVPPGQVSYQFKAKNETPAVTWGRAEAVNVSYGAVTVPTNQCRLEFLLPESMGPPVLLYYLLDGFYQNHRRYVTSFDDSQLKGLKSNGSTCSPLSVDDATGKPIYPCGLIANSVFNDTFTSPLLLNVPDSISARPGGGGGNTNNNATYFMAETGIAWDSDLTLYGVSKYSNDEVVPPPNWRLRFPQYDDKTPIPDLRLDEHFQVWMRTAGLPTFSKLYMRNDTTAMVRGTYRVDINDNFPTTAYKGHKSLIITTKTIMGGKNSFAGIAYIVVGGLCILFGTVFTITHLVRPRKLGDHTYLAWNNAPNAGNGKQPAGNGKQAILHGPNPGTATATGREIA